jgi:exopolyphosphatase/pppGpp-phosphohydrolase
MPSVRVSDLGLREGVLIDFVKRIEKHCDGGLVEEKRSKARAAWCLSHELIQDLIAGTQAYWIFQKQLEARPAREPVPTAIRRLCLTHCSVEMDRTL